MADVSIQPEPDIVDPNQVMPYLYAVQYPAYKQDLIEAAENSSANNYCVVALKLLSDREFHTAADVYQELSTVEIT